MGSVEDEKFYIEFLKKIKFKSINNSTRSRRGYSRNEGHVNVGVEHWT